MNTRFADDIKAIQAIESVPTILSTVAETTGLRFVCVARVTPESWTTCAVLDKLAFGLQPGDELDVATTICDEVRAEDKAVFINHVSEDQEWCRHQTPQQYGFESYFSVPIYRPNGEFFGTLCGLDPTPANVDTPKVRDMLRLFADLISHQLKAEKQLTAMEAALRDERELSELREQFIAVLGHDLRTPLSSIVMGAEVLKRINADEQTLTVLHRIEGSANRIARIIDNVVDFTHGSMGSGIPLNITTGTELSATLQHVVAELESTYNHCDIRSHIHIEERIACDPLRIAQLVSNLMTNALVHGDSRQPVEVHAHCENGELTIAVSNAGEPIPEGTMERLFQPFFRGGKQNTNSGLGLGLYIASQIAQAHGGRLTVSSSVERTTFTFSAMVSGAGELVSHP